MKLPTLARYSSAIGKVLLKSGLRGGIMLKADESPRQVGRWIVIHLELEPKVGRQKCFSTNSSNSRLRGWRVYGDKPVDKLAALCKIV